VCDGAWAKVLGLLCFWSAHPRRDFEPECLDEPREALPLHPQRLRSACPVAIARLERCDDLRAKNGLVSAFRATDGG
jgi:hypothetical protein